MSEETIELLTGTMYDISLYLGILGFLLFIFSFLTGMRIIKPNPKYRLHKRIGIIGFTAMFFHGCVMLFFNVIYPYFS